jgi:hypothetical protein
MLTWTMSAFRSFAWRRGMEALVKIRRRRRSWDAYEGGGMAAALLKDGVKIFLAALDFVGFSVESEKPLFFCWSS